MELPRTAVKLVEIDVDATLPSGAPTTPAGVEFAFCDHAGPTATTVWVAPQSFTGGVAVVKLAGREATDLAGALVLRIPRGELYVQPTGGSSRDPGYVDTVEGL